MVVRKIASIFSAVVGNISAQVPDAKPTSARRAMQSTKFSKFNPALGRTDASAICVESRHISLAPLLHVLFLVFIFRISCGASAVMVNTIWTSKLSVKRKLSPALVFSFLFPLPSLLGVMLKSWQKKRNPSQLM